jgi:hypothetical protein
MIVIHIDSQKDTAFLKECYKGIENLTLLYNPSKTEVNKVLSENPNEDVMMLGHGSPSGLFSHDWKGNVIDYTNVHLLKGRNCIGIWCFAKKFAKNYGLKGYFTNMFISNAGEAKAYGYKATDEEVFAEVEFFSKAVNTLVVDGVPYGEWVGKLQSIANMDKDFVEFNYSAMEYFDGTQKPDPKVYTLFDDDYSAGSSMPISTYPYTYPRDYEDDLERSTDSEVDMWFEDYCTEHGIEGDWAKELAKPIFVAGWNSRKYADGDY